MKPVCLRRSLSAALKSAPVMRSGFGRHETQITYSQSESGRLRNIYQPLRYLFFTLTCQSLATAIRNLNHSSRATVGPDIYLCMQLVQP